MGRTGMEATHTTPHLSALLRLGDCWASRLVPELQITRDTPPFRGSEHWLMAGPVPSHPLVLGRALGPGAVESHLCPWGGAEGGPVP